MTPAIKVADYAGFGHSYLVTDRATPENGGDAPHAAGCSGLGAWVRVGLLSRKSVFCALYELNSQVWLQIRGAKYCLSEDTQRLEHLTAPLVRRFVLTNGSGTNIVDVRYWWVGMRDPFPDSGDFFEYVARSCRSAFKLAEFVCYWKTRFSSHGPVTEQELSRVRQCVEERLNHGDFAKTEFP